MFQERVLNNKLKELCELKSTLASRNEESKGEVVEKIKKSVDDLEFILRYFHYIDDEEEIKESRQVKEFTLVDLEKYNGQNGAPAYAVVDGTVYDVTDVMEWKNGEHYGIKAGENITKSFYQCHNENKEVIKKARVVGVLSE
jgi:predicted heme/steroid binding protein